MHHNKGKQYSKVYWPFIPLIALIMLGAGFALPSHPTQETLAFATNMSTKGLLDNTNSVRQINGDEALKLNERLTAAAQAKANDMASRNYWSHTTPDGNEPWYFVSNAGYSYEKAGENLAYGFTTSDETIIGWMNSPSHRSNMLDKTFKEVGFGFANANNYQGHGAETVVVAMYAVPATGGSKTPSSNGVYSSTSQPVSRIQLLTNGRLAWLPFLVGLASGLALTFLIIKHGLALHRLVVRGETFFTHHPVLDVVLLVIVVAGLYLGKTAGFIA